jgi:cysteinyl-tRNA synthetase
MPYLRALSSFRDGVRQLAISKGDGAAREVLALCDKLRDSDLVPLGVALDDQEGRSCFDSDQVKKLIRPIFLDGKALVKLVDPAELIRAREEKREQAEAKAAKKAAAQELERQKKQQKLERGSIPPEQLFKPPNVPEGTYGSWDDQGVPLTDGEGQELRKNQTKKVQKELIAQRKLHEEYLAWKKESG